MISLISALNEVRRRVDAMPLSPEQEAVCERLAKGESEPLAAVLIRQQAREIDDLWDRLSHACAIDHRESPAEMIQKRCRRCGRCLRSDGNSRRAAKALQAAFVARL
jgi:hypothetical protein